MSGRVSVGFVLADKLLVLVLNSVMESNEWVSQCWFCFG